MHSAALCREVAEQFEGSAGSSEGSELAGFGCLCAGYVAAGEAFWVGFPTKEDVSEGALHPARGQTLPICPFAVVWGTSQELQLLAVPYRPWVTAGFGKGRTLLRGQPSLPRPDCSKLPIAKAENWQTNDL